MDILAHRGNLEGPNPTTENRRESVEAALSAGFGVETDLRRDPAGRFYIAHDPCPWSEANDFAGFSALFRRHDEQTVAMNVKELGYEADLIALEREGTLGTRSFYFDFELLEPQRPGTAQRTLRSLPRGYSVRLAARLSDRNETLPRCLAIPAEIVWADEFDALWLTREVVDAVHRAKRLFTPSPPSCMVLMSKLAAADGWTLRRGRSTGCAPIIRSPPVNFSVGSVHPNPADSRAAAATDRDSFLTKFEALWQVAAA